MANITRAKVATVMTSQAHKTLLILHFKFKNEMKRETFVRNIELNNFDFIIIVCTARAISDHITSHPFGLLWTLCFFCFFFLSSFKWISVFVCQLPAHLAVLHLRTFFVLFFSYVFTLSPERIISNEHFSAFFFLFVIAKCEFVFN